MFLCRRRPLSTSGTPGRRQELKPARQVSRQGPSLLFSRYWLPRMFYFDRPVCNGSRGIRANESVVPLATGLWLLRVTAHAKRMPRGSGCGFSSTFSNGAGRLVRFLIVCTVHVFWSATVMI